MWIVATKGDRKLLEWLIRLPQSAYQTLSREHNKHTVVGSWAIKDTPDMGVGRKQVSSLNPQVSSQLLRWE